MNGASWLVDALLRESVDTVFGYPGGAIMPFYDALHGSALRHVLVRHEQGAAFAANGYARASGRVGVCVATSGPGASNLVTGIADAWLDSVPMVCITGQVGTALMGTDAFQELDVFGMTMSIVKHSYVVRRIDDLPAVLAEAFFLARGGRPGPVLIDLPKDVQQADAGHLAAHVPRARVPIAAASDASLHAAVALLAHARKPIIYAGGGIVLGEALRAFRGFAEAARIPVVQTLKGIGALPDDHELNLGMLGMHGSRAANLAVQQSDLLFVVGARFDDRATGRLDGFAPFARVVHLDADRAEIGKLRHADAAVHGDLITSLLRLTPPVAAQRHARNGSAREQWLQQVQESAATHAARYDAPGEQVFAPALLRELSHRLPEAIVCCDVGQHQMWVAQHWAFNHPRQHLTSGALGAMGFGLPAAIGAQFENPQATVICVSGDGSFMMNVQELATVARYRLPIKILLLDNQVLGMVRQWQTLFFDGRHSEVDLSDNPDFCALAAAFGIGVARIETRADIASAIDAWLSTPGPALLHVAIDPAANVWPLVPPNRSNGEMLDGESDIDVDADADALQLLPLPDAAPVTTPDPAEVQLQAVTKPSHKESVHAIPT